MVAISGRKMRHLISPEYFSSKSCKVIKNIEIAAKLMKILMRFHPLIDGEMKIANSEPNPPIVPKRSNNKLSKERSARRESTLCPAAEVTKHADMIKSPSTPKTPNVAEVFSLTKGVDEL